MSSTHLELLRDDVAREHLHNHDFLHRWQTLYDNCPDATASQEPEFACAWYNEYQARWQPIIITAHNADNALVGLLLLAYDPATKTLSHAGGEQAEYQTWLALPHEELEFLTAAWDALTQNFDFSTLRFRFLPTARLGEVLTTVPNMAHVAVRQRNRPLIHLNADEIKASFAKKRNKSRFNRLKKLGTLEFRRITDPAELESVFDELIAFYDLRQGAVNHSTPFKQDANKRPFHSKLFAAAPNKVFLTVTYLNEQPIAGLWGTISGKTVSNAMIMHSPFLAEHSLGKLHIMQLSNLLIAEGMEFLDLTPGSDPWKERFANAHDVVAEAIIYKTAWAKIKGEMLYALLQWVKQRANQAGITTAEIQASWAMLRATSPATMVGKIRAWFNSRREFRLYRLPSSAAEHFCTHTSVHCNTLTDILAFEASTSGQTYSEFLSDALLRLEFGERIYTVYRDNRLTHYGWMGNPHPKSLMSKLQQSLVFLPNSLMLYDLYAHPDAKHEDDYRLSIQHMVHDAFKDKNTHYVYLRVPEDALEKQQVIETMGFVCQ